MRLTARKELPWGLQVVVQQLEHDMEPERAEDQFSKNSGERERDLIAEKPQSNSTLPFASEGLERLRDSSC